MSPVLFRFSIVIAALAGCAGPGARTPPPSGVEWKLANPGFEDGWNGWVASPESGKGTALSEEGHSGAKSIELTAKAAFVSQVVDVQPGTTYRLSAFVRGRGNLGAKVGAELFFEQQKRKTEDWTEIAVTFDSGERSSVTIFCSFAAEEVRFDDFRLLALDHGAVQTSARVISSRAGGYGLSPDLPPGQNFDLRGWKLNTPADDDGDGKSDVIDEAELAKGAIDERYFFTGSDGGMVFKATIEGARTSKNTKYTRTELREMLRRGDRTIKTRTEDKSPNRNNWVFSSAPEKARAKAGGVDGVLRATLAVNQVTTTGARNEVGRVVIGQIHAAKDEPVRLYYRKLPEHQRGSLYMAHEPSGEDDIWYPLIGSRADDAADPPDGIALNERFSYEIDARGNLLRVRITQRGKTVAEGTIDMTDSGYDVYNDFMYFKAGVYIQDHTGEPDDYVQATFYELEYEHGD